MQILLNVLDRDIQSHLTYPSLAQTHIQQGSSQLSFNLNTNGQISDIEIDKSSGVQVLDEAAVQAVEESSPLVMPLHLAQTIHLSLPVNFSLE
jgi:protein TonB